MFYCNECGKERNWPINTFIVSIGTCEICGKTAECNNIPAKELPIPGIQEKETSTKKTYTIGYKCYNCGIDFSKELPFGVQAIGKGGACPYCGVKDYINDNDGTTKTHIILGR